MVLITGDGLIYASSMVMLDSERRKEPVPMLARWLLGLGIVATLAANVARGLGHGLMGAAVAAWPAVALVGAYELLMMVIRSSQAQADSSPKERHETDRCRNRRPNCRRAACGGPGSLDPCYPRSVSRWPATRPAPAKYLAVEVGGRAGTRRVADGRIKGTPQSSARPVAESGADPLPAALISRREREPRPASRLPPKPSARGGPNALARRGAGRPWCCARGRAGTGVA
jgi:hypothetical protein